MIEVKLHNVIAREDNAWYYSWDGEDGVFSLDFVQRLFENNPSETDFKFNIHCLGGEVEEGLAIYDYLRTSGKNIHMNIEGSCHSMAVTLLLAAPAENRTANPNCRALIHKVWSYAGGGTADDFEAAAEVCRSLQNSILDIYADRTGKDRTELETILNEQRERTAQELLSWGFITKINTYNTNFKQQSNRMAKKTLKEKAEAFLNSVQKFIGSVASNYEFVGEDGEVLFTTEAEDDTLEVGMPATPDGEYTIADGRKVTIADGVITEIVEPTTDDNRITELEAENADLRQQLTEASNLIREFQKSTGCNYVPGNRVGATAKATRGNNEPSSEERMNAIRDRLKKTNKK